MHSSCLNTYSLSHILKNVAYGIKKHCVKVELFALEIKSYNLEYV